jgi:predicted metal-binding membrane protein
VTSAQAAAPASVRTGPGPAWAAVRTRVALVALLLVLAAVGWWLTARWMEGMDGGPWTDLGTFAWFVGVWIVMMAAMMFPSVAPTVALYSRLTRSRSPGLPVVFTSGYLLVWGAVGVLAFGLAGAGGRVAGAILPFKDVCLGKCRSPLGFLLGSWRDGPEGALAMGMRHGAWCVGCCWALMASLFALGVMSLVWMAVVAALIALEKLVPRRRVATLATVGVLLVLGGLLLAAPNALPGLTIPGTGSMPGMSQMSNTDDGSSQRMPAKPMGRTGPKPAGSDLGMSPMGP